MDASRGHKEVLQVNNLTMSILLPTYNRAASVLRTLNSIREQDFSNFEILVWDDCSKDDTSEKVRGIDDDRIRYHRNDENMGLTRNLQACYEKAAGDIIFLMADDDLLLQGALLKTRDAFLRGGQIGVVTRPYYWFWSDPRKPIRAVLAYDRSRDSEISIFQGRKEIGALFRSAGQMSGLAFRRSYVDVPFQEDIFVTHVYPFASILRKYKAVYLRDYTVAVRTPLSISSHRQDVYVTSPLQSWVRMFCTLYPGVEHAELRKNCIDFIAKDTEVGLIQIKTATSSNQAVLREISTILSYRPRSAFDLDFCLSTLMAVLTPGRILRRVVDFYKLHLLSKIVSTKMDDQALQEMTNAVS